MLNKVKSAFGGKKILAGLGILSLVLAVAGPVWAATEAGVTATVTAQNISVTVDVPSVAYGTLDVNTESSPSPIITATNNGNVTENFNIKGSNSTNWTLSDVAAAPETFMHKFAKSQDSYAAYTALHNTNYKPLAASVATSGTQLFRLKLTMPTSTSFFTQQSTTVTVQATL